MEYQVGRDLTDHLNQPFLSEAQFRQIVQHPVWLKKQERMQS